MATQTINLNTWSAKTASIWDTSRTLTIGNKGQSVDGSTNVTWDLNDILYNTTNIGTSTTWDQFGPGLFLVSSGSAFTGTNHPGNDNEIAPYTYGQLIVARANAGGILQVYAPHTGSSGAVTAGLRYRTGWNSTDSENAGHWQSWSTLLDDRLWRKYIFANKNIGLSSLTVTNSTWAVTSGTDLFGLSFKDTGLQYTPSGGSATASSTTGEWRAWLTCAATSDDVSLNMRIDGTWQASKFIGPLEGNASTASSATVSTYVKCSDTRSTALNPSDLKATNAVRFDFKAKSITGLSENFSGIMSYRPYSQNSDWSGGPAHQLAFDGAGLHWRKSTGDAAWDSWQHIITSAGGTLTGDINIGTSGAGGKLNGSATDGGINTLELGNDVWIGDCNTSGILGIKSTDSADRTGLRFYTNTGSVVGNLIASSYGLYTDYSLRAGVYAANTAQSSDYQVRVDGGAGSLYMYSEHETTANRGLYGCNSAGTHAPYLTVNQNNEVTLHGNAATATLAATASDLSYSTAEASFGGSSNAINCRKHGHIVIITIQVSSSNAIASKAVGGTIPEGYRPSFAHYYQGAVGSTLVHFGFYADGTIKPQSAITSGSTVRLDCVYTTT